MMLTTLSSAVFGYGFGHGEGHFPIRISTSNHQRCSMLSIAATWLHQPIQNSDVGQDSLYKLIEDI